MELVAYAHVSLSVFVFECLAAGPFVANAMLGIQQSHLGNCRTWQSVRKAAPSHSSASLPYAEIKKSQGTCKPGHGRVTSSTPPPPSPPGHHLSWLVAAAVQIMAKQAFQLAPDSWHERSPCPTLRVDTDSDTTHTATRTGTPTPGKGSWQPIRQVSAPLETDLLWATYGPCLASFMASSLAGNAGMRACGQASSSTSTRLVPGKSFLISPGCSLVTKIVELAKAPLGRNNNNGTALRNWKRACSMRHFSLKVSLFVVPPTSILISRQKPSR